MVVFLILSGKSCGIWSPGHSACVCISLKRPVHCSSDMSRAGLSVHWQIGVERTSFKGTLDRFALCLNSLKNPAVHIKLRRESKIMTLSNNEKCNSDYNERREWCLHFLGTLLYIEKFLRINWTITRAIKPTVWTSDKISKAKENVAKGTDIWESTKNFLLRSTLLTAPKLHLLSFCDKLSYLLLLPGLHDECLHLHSLNYDIFILPATTHHWFQCWRGRMHLPKGKHGMQFRSASRKVLENYILVVQIC